MKRSRLVAAGAKRLSHFAAPAAEPPPAVCYADWIAPRSKRWMAGVCLGLLLAFLVADTIVRHFSLAAITAVRTSDVSPVSIPVSQGARVRDVVLPFASVDGRWWVIHAEEFLRKTPWRVRHTDLDNAPHGREVHWSSGPVWLLAATARALAIVTGKPPVDCVQVAAFWFGPITLALSLGLLGWLAMRAFGVGPALHFAAIFCLSPPVYQAFRAGEVDHHGVALATAVASVLCLVAGGGGMMRRDTAKAKAAKGAASPLAQARWWFRWAGVLGGAALWISASSFIPILAGCALGALAAFFLRDRKGTTPVPELWRAWGAVGCASSLCFYVLEYFPGHMGWRLEVNHPLFALAWLGAGDLLARTLSLLAGKSAFPRAVPGYFAAVASVFALALPAALVMTRPQDVFWVADKFLLLLFADFIQELYSVPRLLAQTSIPLAILELFTWPAFVVAGAILLHARGILMPRWRSLLGLALVPALLVQALAFRQIRWSILAAGLWAVCALVLLAASAARREKRCAGFGIGLAVAWMLTLATLPLGSLLAVTRPNAVREQLPKAAIPAILMRDVAHRLVQSSPQRLPVVLSGPTTSTDLSYFGGIKTLGTLYWENLPGLKSAARIFAAPDETHARAAIEAAGVTHILVSTWDNFGRAYAQLLRRAGVEVPAEGGTFIEKLLRENQPPDWLRPLYYPIPAGFDIKEEVRLYTVVPDQSAAQARLHRGIYALDAHDFAAAEKLLGEAVAFDPRNAEARQLLDATRQQRAAQSSKPNENPTQP